MRLRSLALAVASALGCASPGGSYIPFDDDAGGALEDSGKDHGPERSGSDRPEPSELLLPGCVPPERVCAGQCVDVSVNLQHCGRCNNRCGDGQSCVMGVCTDPPPVCAPPRMQCGAACVDPQGDLAHCGRCNNRCPSGQTCSAGTCVGASPTCMPPRVQCGTTCTDVNSDPSNCGVCGFACAAGQSCVGGNCVVGGGTCPPPRQLCAGTCTDLQSDGSNCGACGRRCTTGETCVAGRCMAGSTPGGTRAGAPCTNADPSGGMDPACGATLVCVPTGSLPMCTAECSDSPSQITERSMCGGGNATCLTQGDGPMASSICTQACTPGPSPGCRPGFACTGWWYTHANARPDSPGCFPFCTSDAHCPSGRRCNTRIGTCGTSAVDLTRLPDGSPCNPTVTVMVPGETQPRNVQCRGVCFRVSSTSPTQGICGSFVDLAAGRACPDDPANVDLLAPPGQDNLALCVFRSCTRNADCTAPLVCRYPEDASGVPDRTQPPDCQYPTAAQRTGIP
jgi:hypothetical protein